MLCAVISAAQIILIKHSWSTTVGKRIYCRRKELALQRCNGPLKDFGNEVVLHLPCRRWAPAVMTEVNLAWCVVYA